MIDLDVRDTDMIDSRELLEQFESLEGQTQECEACADLATPNDHCPACEGSGEVPDRDEDEEETYQALKSLVDEVGYVQMRDGVTFIAESYFKEYARQFAEDIGAIDGDTRWPATHIDWEGAAADLQQDYTSTEIDDTTYYWRA